MRKPKIREIREAVTALIKGPYTAKFPFGPAPIQETFRGKPVYHEEDCIGCGACSEVCPPGAIVTSIVKKNGNTFKKLTIDLGVCVFCGVCVEKCTTEKGITQSLEFDLASLDPAELMESVEKEMVECELCDRPFATKSQLKWIYERIGALAAGNWTLMLVGQEELGIHKASASQDNSKILRKDHMKLLCPECRKNTILADEWGSYD